MEFEFLFDGAVKNLSFEKKGEGYVVREDDRVIEADIQAISPNILSLVQEGRSYTIHFARDGEILHLFLNGHVYTIQEASEESSASTVGGAKSMEDMLRISAPMPGKVIKVCVEDGEEIREKQTLVIVEAMKMENEVKAELDCRVKKIHCAQGDLVDVTNVLIELEELDKDAS